ncbi:MAG: hypothetical protein AUK50_00835 [Comamonadaceae bacterium CG2_30_57_122]|nr:MAG: hypothetical protein AUK50_00835 [Comamonadaceae bacterium CG2_30_57_122]
MVKMQEPKVNVPLELVAPSVKVKGTALEPAAGAENVKVVAPVVPKAVTADGKVTVLAATKTAIAALEVAGLIATETGAETAETVAGPSLPPQAAKEAANTTAKASFEPVLLIKENAVI